MSPVFKALLRNTVIESSTPPNSVNQQGGEYDDMNKPNTSETSETYFRHKFKNVELQHINSGLRKVLSSGFDTGGSM